MIKISFTLLAVSSSRFNRNITLLKRVKEIGCSSKRLAHSFATSLRNTSSPLLKGLTVLGFAMAMNVKATAQCNTFLDADSANPLHAILSSGRTIVSVNFIDIDNDGDLDCYINFSDNNRPVLYRNTGNSHHPVFEESNASGWADTTYPPSNRYTQYVDIDGDGDYDCFISNTKTGDNTVRLYYYENTGTAESPNFVRNENKNPVRNFVTYQNMPFTFADMDRDGDLDFYYYDHNTIVNTSYKIVLINTGTKQHAVFNTYYQSIQDTFGLPGRTYYDWNKDGLIDYFDFNDITNQYYKNIRTVSKPKYALDNADAPVLSNGTPYRIVDLNNDNAPEIFTTNGHYSTLAPVAIIVASQQKAGTKTITKLSSKNQSSAFSYSWEYNGTVIPNATKPTINATQNGTYTLYVKNSCGTGVSLNYVVTTNTVTIELATDKISSTGDEVTSAITIKTYPNPFTSEITVQLGNATKNTIKITDVSGKELFTQTTSASTVAIGKTLQKGTYVLQVFRQNEMIYHAIILKQ